MGSSGNLPITYFFGRPSQPKSRRGPLYVLEENTSVPSGRQFPAMYRVYIDATAESSRAHFGNHIPQYMRDLRLRELLWPAWSYEARLGKPFRTHKTEACSPTTQQKDRDREREREIEIKREKDIERERESERSREVSMSKRKGIGSC